MTTLFIKPSNWGGPHNNKGQGGAFCSATVASAP